MVSSKSTPDGVFARAQGNGRKLVVRDDEEATHVTPLPGDLHKIATRDGQHLRTEFAIATRGVCSATEVDNLLSIDDYIVQVSTSSLSGSCGAWSGRHGRRTNAVVVGAQGCLALGRVHCPSDTTIKACEHPSTCHRVIQAAGEHKRPPSLPLSHETNRLQRETAFNCRIQFRNDLPEVGAGDGALIVGAVVVGKAWMARDVHALLLTGPSILPQIPCDPKILLPAINPRELGAFRLTSLEKELKRDMLFEPDLGIPLAPLSITRYELPGTSHELAPADAELLEVWSRLSRGCWRRGDELGAK